MALATIGIAVSATAAAAARKDDGATRLAHLIEPDIDDAR